MKCFVCGGEMTPYFEKNFGMKHVDKCEYVCCENCGLVVSKTVYEMPREQWEKLNYECHSALFNKGEIDYRDIDPNVFVRFETQSDFFSELVKHGIFKPDWKAVDYGAGDGTLADMTNKKIGTAWLKKFDAYMEARDENYLSEVSPKSFDFLVSSSVFEHLNGIEGDVDRIIELIKPTGIMGLHTLICEEVPQNPNWFYALLPIHCTFWTNKATQILFEKAGFKRCAYHVEARMWLMFRNVEDFERLKSSADKLTGTLVFSENFVDYWKLKPEQITFPAATASKIYKILDSWRVEN